jgi:hypothetical protein
LICLLALSSAANATLSLVVDGQEVGSEITLTPGETVWIGTYADIPPNYVHYAAFAAYVIMDTTPLGSWTGASKVYVPPAAPGVAGWTYYGTTVDPAMDAWFEDYTLPGFYDLGGPGLYGEVEFRCDAPGDVFINLYDDAFDMVDTLTIHQIPEPATLILLSLGGLVLRRKH